MTWTVVYTKTAGEAIRKLDPSIRERVRHAVELLAILRVGLAPDGIRHARLRHHVERAAAVEDGSELFSVVLRPVRVFRDRFHEDVDRIARAVRAVVASGALREPLEG